MVWIPLLKLLLGLSRPDILVSGSGCGVLLISSCVLVYLGQCLGLVCGWSESSVGQVLCGELIQGIM